MAFSFKQNYRQYHLNISGEAAVIDDLSVENVAQSLWKSGLLISLCLVLEEIQIPRWNNINSLLNLFRSS